MVHVDVAQLEVARASHVSSEMVVAFLQLCQLVQSGRPVPGLSGRGVVKRQELGVKASSPRHVFRDDRIPRLGRVRPEARVIEGGMTGTLEEDQH